VISLEDVRVSYGPAVALDGVTERAADGEWLCLIGPNGAGKTTLLQAVARQVRHGGRIEVCGQPTGGMSRRKLARLVAYVPQRPQLPPDMTVGDYVLLGRTPHIGYLRVETDADRRISAELIDRLALSAMAGRELRTLSGGSSWPARWPSRRRSCCLTSRRAPWTSAAGSMRSNWSTRCAGSGRSPSCPPCTT